MMLSAFYYPYPSKLFKKTLAVDIRFTFIIWQSNNLVTGFP